MDSFATIENIQVCVLLPFSSFFIFTWPYHTILDHLPIQCHVHPMKSEHCITRGTTINKFRCSEPPPRILDCFLRLGFDVTRHASGSDAGKLRSSVQQVHQDCQLFVSFLEPEDLRCFRSPFRGYSNPKVVDEKLLQFLEWKGPSLFGPDRQKHHPRLLAYSSGASQKRYGSSNLLRACLTSGSLLRDFKPLREILQSLAVVLNQVRPSKRYSTLPDDSREESLQKSRPGKTTD